MLEEKAKLDEHAALVAEEYFEGAAVLTQMLWELFSHLIPLAWELKATAAKRTLLDHGLLTLSLVMNDSVTILIFVLDGALTL